MHSLCGCYDLDLLRCSVRDSMPYLKKTWASWRKSRKIPVRVSRDAIIRSRRTNLKTGEAVKRRKG